MATGRCFGSRWTERRARSAPVHRLQSQITMSPYRPKLSYLLGASAVASTLLMACAGPSRPSSPSTLPPSSQTLYSTGFVDNAGRTSDERGRTELSGMRATEAGSQQPVGTPASGLPVPLGPRPERFEAPRAYQGSQAKAEPARSATVARPALESLSRAYCERERKCGRLANDQASACQHAATKRFGENIGGAGCPYSLDATKVAGCATSIRETPCESSAESVASSETCDASTMCLPSP